MQKGKLFNITVLEEYVRQRKEAFQTFLDRPTTAMLSNKAGLRSVVTTRSRLNCDEAEQSASADSMSP